MNKNEYKCEGCNGIFEKGWSDSDAEEEKIANGWGDVPEEDTVTICDDCYKEFMINFN